MKLSIIYLHKNSESRETIKDIVSQLNDECELIISTQGSGSLFKEFKVDNVKAVKQRQGAYLDLKNALKTSQGEYIAFVFEYDKVNADYVKSILLKLTDDNKAYYPLKWRFVDWHNLAYCGSNALPLLFANVYSKNIALKLSNIDKAEAFYKVLAEYESGEAINKIIYMHWREK